MQQWAAIAALYFLPSSKYTITSVPGVTIVFIGVLCHTAFPVPVGTIANPTLVKVSPASRILIPKTLGTTALPGGATALGSNAGA